MAAGRATTRERSPPDITAAPRGPAGRGYAPPRRVARTARPQPQCGRNARAPRGHQARVSVGIVSARPRLPPRGAPAPTPTGWCYNQLWTDVIVAGYFEGLGVDLKSMTKEMAIELLANDAFFLTPKGRKACLDALTKLFIFVGASSRVNQPDGPTGERTVASRGPARSLAPSLAAASSACRGHPPLASACPCRRRPPPAATTAVTAGYGRAATARCGSLLQLATARSLRLSRYAHYDPLRPVR